MGAYLSSPVLDKESESGGSKRLRYGVSQMQGWRRSMEDAHLAQAALEGSDQAALFGVFDGHGGREVALFVARHMADELLGRSNNNNNNNTPTDATHTNEQHSSSSTGVEESPAAAFRAGQHEAALKRLFHRMDDLLRQEQYEEEIRLLRHPPKPPPNMPPTPGQSLPLPLPLPLPVGEGSSEEVVVGEEGRMTQEQAIEVMLQQLLVLRQQAAQPLPPPTPLDSADGQGEEEGEEGGVFLQALEPVGGRDDEEEEEEEEEEEVCSPQPLNDATSPHPALGTRSHADLVVEGAEGEEEGVVEEEGEDESSDEDDSKGPPNRSHRIKTTHALQELKRQAQEHQIAALGKGGAGEGAGSEELVGGISGAAAKAALAMPLRLGGASNRLCSLPDHKVQAGCTSVVALLVGEQLYVANAGDSRAVLCREGVAIGLSEDHKPMEERERTRIHRAGGFVTDQGRVNGNLNLSRSIGDLKYKGNPLLKAEDQMITAEPDVTCHLLTPQDEFFLLACDGVWDCNTNQQAVDFVRARLLASDKDDPSALQTIAEQLLDACVAEDPRKTGGIGGDNMTCLIVDLRPGHRTRAAQSSSPTAS